MNLTSSEDGQTGEGDGDGELLRFLSALSSFRDSDPRAFKRMLSSAGVKEDVDLRTIDIESLSQALKERPELREELHLPHKEEVKSLEIHPNPGFTLKTVLLNTPKKIFINICSHEAISEPGLKKKLNDKNEEVEGWNIPMSIGPPRQDADHAGVVCLVHDVIVNPKVIEETNEDKTGKHRDFICQLSLQCLEEKFEYHLDRKYKLPKTRYKGSLEPQRIQDRRGVPKIVELQSKENTVPIHSKSVDKKSINADEKPVELKYFWKSSSTDKFETREVSEFVFSSDYVDPIASLEESIQSLQIDCLLRAYHIEAEETPDLQMHISAFKFKVILSFDENLTHF